MASRRDSRVHLSIKQNDALLEFENFKRKYLLVNKHITKLNSTLSVRVEELNAQVSTLYVENLRLRASEISLVSQLKKEKEKAQRVVDEAEISVGNLMGRLSEIRASLSAEALKNISSSPKHKAPAMLVQPPREAVRLVRPPADTITLIRESDEEDADEEDITPTRTVTTRRPSASRLPLPRLASTPQSAVAIGLAAIPHINLAAGATKRKPGRRNSSLLSVEHQFEVERASSPVAVPARSIRRSSFESDAEEREVELEVQVGIGPDVENEEQEPPKMKTSHTRLDETRILEWPRSLDRKGKGRQAMRDWEQEEIHSTSERDSSEGSKEKEKKRRCGIKDVTNSPRKGVAEFTEDKPTKMPDVVPSPIISTPSSATTQLFDVLTPKASASLLSAPSTPATDGGSEGGENTIGREKRARKSVNYAEPKLNTKMRKPDPPETTRPRSSTAGTVTRRRKSNPSQNVVLASDEDGDADVEGSGSTIRIMEGRRKTVHNTTVKISQPPSGLGNIVSAGEPYGLRGDEARRHSMAV